MPVQVLLFVPDDTPAAAWRRLEECPGIRRLRELHPPDRFGWLDVTALALAFDPRRDVLAADDAAFLAREGTGRVLGLAHVRVRGGPRNERPPRAAIHGQMRRRFLAWVARVACETAVPLELRYEHERGDFLYELALWTWVPSEALYWSSYDGCAEPIWTGAARRWRPAAPSPVRFDLLAGLLKGVKLR